MVFITPGGLTVGSSGVLNVGQLSVATPTAAKFGSLINEYDANNFTNIQQVKKLKQDSNADIAVDGKILARRGVDLRGQSVSVAGQIVNGVVDNTLLNSKAEADTLFDNLVNTNGSFKSGVTFASDGGRILIKSEKTGGMNVTGTLSTGVASTVPVDDNVGLYVTNNGDAGMEIDGKLYSNTITRAYNAKGQLQIKENAVMTGPEVVAQNRGSGMNLGYGSKLDGTTYVTVQNEGGNAVVNSDISAPLVKVLNKAGAGTLNADGKIVGDGGVYFVNKGDGLFVSSKIENKTKDNAETAINNYNGNLTLEGAEFDTKGTIAILNREGSGKLTIADIDIGSETAKHKGDVRIVNVGTGGMDIMQSRIENEGNLRIYNDAGKLTISGSDEATQIKNIGNVYIGSRNNSTGMSIERAQISNTGNMYIRNKSGNEGLTIKSGANIVNKNGTLAINNDKGNMNVNGKISIDNGQMGIINRAGGGSMTLAESGTVTVNNAYANIKNNGQGNMTVNSAIENTSGENYTGRVNVIANSGALSLNGTVHNNAGAINGLQGGFYAVVRQNGTGLTVGEQFVVDGNGEVLIKNISGDNGLDFNGTINTTDNQAALSNKKGDLNVNGKITTTNAPIILYNANTGKALNIRKNAQLNSGTEGKIINAGSEKIQQHADAQVNNMQKYGNK